jgi:hypothetical protein
VLYCACWLGYPCWWVNGLVEVWGDIEKLETGERDTGMP